MQISLPMGFEELTQVEQIEYIGALWDWVISQAEEVPSPPWHWDIVADRVASHDRDRARPWSEVRQRLWSRYGGE